MLDIEVDESFIEDFLHIRLAAVGHDTKKVLATDDAYNALDACCNYRALEGTGRRICIGTQSQNLLNIHDIEGHEDVWVDGICGMCQGSNRGGSFARSKLVLLPQTGMSKLRTCCISEQTMTSSECDECIERWYRIGHDTKERKATPMAYESLHGCCKYRDADVIADHAPQEESLIPGFRRRPRYSRNHS